MSDSTAVAGEMVGAMRTLTAEVEAAPLAWFLDGDLRGAAEALIDVLEAMVEGADRQRSHEDGAGA